MQTFKRLTAVILCLCFLTIPVLAGIGTREAMYVGGTLTSVKERTEGKPFIQESAFVFEYGKSQKLEIPYGAINSLEYGQKAGRRLGLAIAISPLFIFSKKRKHFLTIGYLDSEKKQQAAVFELGKAVIEPTLKGLESKTGKSIDYEDAEARKSAGKK
jgi:hypothetical protein